MVGEFFAFVGLPASGKTTIREEMINDGKIDEVISPDEIRFYHFQTQFDPKIESNVWSIVKAHIGICLSKGKRCLLDATNIDKTRRDDILAIPNALNANKTAIVLNMDFDIAYNRNKRPSINVNGREVGQTVPDYAMYRMRYQWDNSGLGNTQESIKKALKYDFDEVKVINRYADEKDCHDMGGRIDSESYDVRTCVVDYDDDLSSFTKYYYME